MSLLRFGLPESHTLSHTANRIYKSKHWASLCNCITVTGYTVRPSGALEVTAEWKGTWEMEYQEHSLTDDPSGKEGNRDRRSIGRLEECLVYLTDRPHCRPNTLYIVRR